MACPQLCVGDSRASGRAGAQTGDISEAGMARESAPFPLAVSAENLAWYQAQYTLMKYDWSVLLLYALFGIDTETVPGPLRT